MSDAKEKISSKTSGLRSRLEGVDLRQNGIFLALLFLIGYFAFNEPMITARWIGFLIVWLAVSVFSYDAVRTYKINKN